MKGSVKYHFLFVLLISALLQCSCNKDNGFDCFKSTGNIITQERNEGIFTKIDLADNINLILEFDSLRSKIMVEAGENLINKITTQVEDSTLYISNDNYCNWTRDFSVPINVYVTIPRLDVLNYRGSGNVQCENTWKNDSILVEVYEGAGSIKLQIDTEQSKIYVHYGTVDIEVSGKAWVSFISLLGYGPIDCLGLESQYIYMNNSSPNDCYVHVIQSLNVEIGGLGNIYFTGFPWNISTNIYGEGQLIDMN